MQIPPHCLGLSQNKVYVVELCGWTYFSNHLPVLRGLQVLDSIELTFALASYLVDIHLATQYVVQPPPQKT